MTDRDDVPRSTDDESTTDRAEHARRQDAHPAPPHPPFARESDDYTDPPGHHRRGPNGPALDVGA